MSDRGAEHSKLSVEDRKTDAAAAPASVSQLLTFNAQLPISPGRRAWRRFKQNGLAVFGAGYIAVLLLLIAAWPLGLKLASVCGSNGAAFSRTYDPDQLSEVQFAPPSVRHWFGTDVHGRDL